MSMPLHPLIAASCVAQVIVAVVQVLAYLAG